MPRRPVGPRTYPTEARALLNIFIRAAFVVEHDIVMATYLSDRVIVYEGTPGVEATAGS